MSLVDSFKHHCTSRIVMNIPRVSPTTRMLIGLVTILSACSARHPSAPIAPPEPTRQSSKPPKTSSAEGWSPSLVAAKLHYTINDSSTISINTDSTRPSTIETETILSIVTTQTGDSFKFRVDADSIVTTTHASISSTVTDTNMMSFDGVLAANGKVSTLTSQRSESCVGGIDPVATRIFELMNNLPKKYMRIGDSWTDTISTTTCRGKTPLLQQTMRRFEVLNIPTREQNTLARIQRLATTSFTGVSPDTKNHISINGSGSATTILSLEAQTGALVESNGTSQTTLTIITSRGSFPFKQNVVTHIGSAER